MALKKYVCQKCRIKELGKDGWNEFAEAWFDPVYENGRRLRDGTTTCPAPIFNRMKDSIKRKILSIATPAEKAVLDKVIFIVNMSGPWTISAEEKPPAWCSYKKEHMKHFSTTKRNSKIQKV